MANELLNALQSQLNDDNLINSLSQQIGGADKEQTKAAANGIMTTLMGAMSKQGTSPQGNSLINTFLDQDGDGSVLDDLMGMMTQSGGQQSRSAGLMGGLMNMLGGNKQQQQQQPQANQNSMFDGANIISSLLGGKQNGAVNMISQISGLDSSQTSNLMNLLGPMFMGTLTKTKKQTGADNAGLMNLVSDSFQQRRQLDIDADEAGPGEGATGLINQFLDQDGDGDISDDITNIGVKFLGNLFK